MGALPCEYVITVSLKTPSVDRDGEEMESVHVALSDCFMISEKIQLPQIMNEAGHILACKLAANLGSHINIDKTIRKPICWEDEY